MGDISKTAIILTRIVQRAKATNHHDRRPSQSKAQSPAADNRAGNVSACLLVNLGTPDQRGCQGCVRVYLKEFPLRSAGDRGSGAGVESWC